MSAPLFGDDCLSFLPQIFVPLLSNPTNHKKWPGVIAKDIQKHVHSLKSTVYQVKGQVNGQTVLPMPVGVERVFEVEKLLIDSDGEMCDLYFKSAVEGVMIKWAAQINEVLVKDSSEKAGCAANPVPTVGKKEHHAHFRINSTNFQKSTSGIYGPKTCCTFTSSCAKGKSEAWP